MRRRLLGPVALAGSVLFAAFGLPLAPAAALTTPAAPTLDNAPTTSQPYGGGFTAVVTNHTPGDTGALSVTSSTTAVCTVTGALAVTYVGVGTCTLTPQIAADTNYAAASGSASSFPVGQGTPAAPTLDNAPTTSQPYGGGFTAVVTNHTPGDTGALSVTSSTTAVCTVTGALAVTYVGVGTCTLTPQIAADANYLAASGSASSFAVGQGAPAAPTLDNAPTTSQPYGGGFTAVVTNHTPGDTGALSVTSTTTAVCTVTGALAVTYVGVGTCTLTPQIAADANHLAASGSPASFAVGQATPTAPTVSDIPTTPVFAGSFKATVDSNSDGKISVTSSTPTVCTVAAADGLTVTFVAAGTCTLTAHVAASTDYKAADGTPQTFPVGKAPAPSAPSLDNVPTTPQFYGQQPPFKATVTIPTRVFDTGALLVKSTTPAVCTVGSDGLTVTYVGVGTCTLTPEIATDPNYLLRDGTPSNISVAKATPSTPTITNLPTAAVEFAGFTANIGTNGDGPTSVVSSTPGVCQVQSDAQTVLFLTTGACSLTSSVGNGTNFNGATGTAQTFQVGPAPRGYWLVGSDGGIFSFGAAKFSGSMGGIVLQRPVVGITPTLTRGGYWLVASDGGIFSFGDAGFYGSVPGVGLHPAGSGMPHSLAAPIVGMVPSINRRGYFMIASDGGVFAFGGAKFAGSCPGIGGCAGAAVAVMPDHTGDGYWLVTNRGGVYAFGDAPFYGAPAPQAVPVVNAAATPDGMGYWLLYANGVVANFGDAVNFGSPVGYVNTYNAANTIFPTADGKGYWVASTRGDVFSYGNAPWLGSMTGKALNGQIIAGFGF